MAAEQPEPRSGRPRATSRRELERIALELFDEQGFDETTVEQIADRAGVSRRTFFRYFDTKAAVVWAEFDSEVDTVRRLLAETADDVPLLDAVRAAVLASNQYDAGDVTELRARLHVITTVPSLGIGAGQRYDEWANAIAAFAAGRLGQDPQDLVPQAIGFSALGVSRAAFDQWLRRHDADLLTYLDQALTAWSTGFTVLPGLR